jgi:hypothetical protein
MWKEVIAVRGMRGSGFRGYGRPIVRPGRGWRRPLVGWWPSLFWGLGLLFFPVVAVLGWFALALLRLIVR